MSFSTETTHVARKAHRCCACGTTIFPLARYIRWAGTTDGDFSCVQYHEVCRAAEIALNDNYGTQYGDDWVSLEDYDRDDIPWLLEEHPDAAIYLGLASAVIPTDVETGGDVSPNPTANSGDR